MHATNESESTEVPAWPVYALTVHDDGRVDASGPLMPASGHTTRASAVDAVAEVAARLGRPVRAEATEPDGTVFQLAISPDGEVSELPSGGSRAKSGKKRHDKRSARAAGRRAGAVAESAAPAVPTAIETAAPVVDTASEPATPARRRATEPATPTAHPVTQPAALTVHTATQPAAAARTTTRPTAATTHTTTQPAAAAARTTTQPTAATTHTTTQPAALVPARIAPARGPRTGPDAHAGAQELALVREYLEAGHVGRAAALAARLDGQAAQHFGVSDPDALRIREVRARVTALAGDALGGVLLYRDVAERWHYQGDSERAEAVAARAETLWLQITDLDTALSAGVAVIRLRSQIPGKDGEALNAALEHRTWLEEARLANVPTAREHPAPEAPVPRRTRTFPTWERPAVDTRAATAG
ncbi:hypothetical protein [Streptomyces sp. NBC_00286]|uniref:hypothetical protein n=1 Tax=Streptomyces sp. NBC_00286 TaxID=2975701 RepID=UPI002E2A9AC2|nr:hypothetical protein [Streptomyces sp. NBC_00286]